MADKLIAELFRGLVSQIGSLEAAAAQIEASTGQEAQISMLSRVQNGSVNVPLTWAWALEDGTGNRCFTRYRTRMIERRGEVDDLPSDLDLASVMNREGSEAVQAIIDLSRDHVAPEVALREVIEAEEAARAAREVIEQRIRQNVQSIRKGAA